MTRFKLGDIIICKRFPGVRRRIVSQEYHYIFSEEVNDPLAGDVYYYLWEYPDLPSGERNLFTSLNSNDPELELWTKEE